MKKNKSISLIKLEKIFFHNLKNINFTPIFPKYSLVIQWFKLHFLHKSCIMQQTILYFVQCSQKSSCNQEYSPKILFSVEFSRIYYQNKVVLELKQDK